MKRIQKTFFSVIAILILATPLIQSQPGNTELLDAIKSIERRFESLNHRLDVVEKKIDDIQWFNRVGDVAYIDKVYMTGPPLAREKNPTAQGAGNPVKFWSYIFFPKNLPT